MLDLGEEQAQAIYAKHALGEQRIKDRVGTKEAWGDPLIAWIALTFGDLSRVAMVLVLNQL